MKNTLLSLLLVSTVALGAIAQNTQSSNPGSDSRSALQPWKLLVYQARGDDVAKDISENVRQGYVPVGMEIEENQSLSILLVRADGVAVTRWTIRDYVDMNTIEDEITAGIRAGYVPMDISKAKNALAVLWVQTDIQIDGWRLHTAKDTPEDRTKAINDFQAQGFSLWGISESDGLVWLLFLKQPGAQRSSAVELYGKDTAAIHDGIQEATSHGWLPYGIAESDTGFMVSYIR